MSLSNDLFPAGSKIKTDEIEASRRHLFLCVGPDCCESESGLALWDQLKRGVKDLGIPVLRTKAACLRVCTDGPWLVVYPEGIWYGAMTSDRLDRILREHVAGGRPVAEWIAVKTGCGG